MTTPVDFEKVKIMSLKPGDILVMEAAMSGEEVKRLCDEYGIKIMLVPDVTKIKILRQK